MPVPLGSCFHVTVDPKLRANLRLNFIGLLFDFASPVMQRLWVTGHPKVIVTFTETMCGWFDDLFGVGAVEGAVWAGWLSEEEEEAIIHDFNAAANAYEEPPGRNEADVLRAPSWSEVVRHAQQAWHALRQALTDPAELKQMAKLEGTWGEIPG